MAFDNDGNVYVLVAYRQMGTNKYSDQKLQVFSAYGQLEAEIPLYADFCLNGWNNPSFFKVDN